MRLLLLPPVVVLMSVGLMLLLHVAAPLVHLVPRPENWAGLVLVAAGFGIANWHAQLFRRIGTNINTLRKPGKLTQEGLFSRTRIQYILACSFSWPGGIHTWINFTSCCTYCFFVLANYWYIPTEEAAMASNLSMNISSTNAQFRVDFDARRKKRCGKYVIAA